MSDGVNVRLYSILRVLGIALAVVSIAMIIGSIAILGGEGLFGPVTLLITGVVVVIVTTVELRGRSRRESRLGASLIRSAMLLALGSAVLGAVIVGASGGNPALMVLVVLVVLLSTVLMFVLTGRGRSSDDGADQRQRE